MARCRLRLQASLHNLSLSLCYFGFAALLQAAKMEQGCLFHLSDDGSYIYDSPSTQTKEIPATPKAPPSFRKYAELYSAEAEAKDNLQLAEKELSRLEALEAIRAVDPTDSAHQMRKEEARIRIVELKIKWQKAKADYDAIIKENEDYMRDRGLTEATPQRPPESPRSVPPRVRPVFPPSSNQRPSSSRSGPWRPYIERSLPNGDRDD